MTLAARRAAYDYGLWAETLCVLWLTLKGYRILTRRERNRMGEIDLIARRGRTIVFIEVKARRLLENGLLALSFHQQRRILNAAQCWIAANPKYHGFDLRCDLIVVTSRFRLTHLPHAFEQQ